MTRTNADPREIPWPRSRWMVVIAIFTALQAGTLLWLAQWPTLPTPVRASPGRMVLDTSRTGQDPVRGLEADPRLFAHVDPQGFSGAASHAFPLPDYRLAEWPGRPRWLGADAGASRLGVPPPPPATTLLRPLRLPPVGIRGEPRAPRVLPTQTVVVPRGLLAGRALHPETPPQLVPGTEVLSPSTVEVGVAPGGEVLVARVTGSSGSPDADQLALAWAQRARFAADAAWDPEDLESGPGPLVWGDLAFVWRIEPPAP